MAPTIDRQLFQEAEHLREHSPAANAHLLPDEPIGVSINPDAVKVAKPDVGHGGSDALGIERLGRFAVLHRLRHVEQDADAQFFFFEEEFQKEFLQAGVHVPVDVPQVIADDVVAVIGELGGLAFSAAAAFAFLPRGVNLPRDDLKLFEPGNEIGVQEGRGRGGDRRCGRRGGHQGSSRVPRV